MHCYSGHLPLAIDLMKEGFYLSLAGPLTYKNAKKTQEVAARVPLDRLMVETDCPYLTPEPHRGKRNEPAHVRLVAQKLADLRNKSLEEIAYLTSLNTQTVFRKSNKYDHHRYTQIYTDKPDIILDNLAKKKVIFLGGAMPGKNNCNREHAQLVTH
jgi:hypothetical protein